MQRGKKENNKKNWRGWGDWQTRKKANRRKQVWHMPETFQLAAQKGATGAVPVHIHA